MRIIDADELHKQLEDELRYDQYSVYKKVYDLIDRQLTVNEWHYPSKGELPPRGEQVLCRLWNGNNVLAFKREDDEWTTNGRFAFDGVKCWQYIIPPKEEA